MDLLEAFIFYCDVVELALAKASEEASEGNERAESRWQRDCKLNSRCGGAGPVPRYGDTPLVTEIPYRVIMKGAASGGSCSNVGARRQAVARRRVAIDDRQTSTYRSVRRYTARHIHVHYNVEI